MKHNYGSNFNIGVISGAVVGIAGELPNLFANCSVSFSPDVKRPLIVIFVLLVAAIVSCCMLPSKKKNSDSQEMSITVSSQEGNRREYVVTIKYLD